MRFTVVGRTGGIPNAALGHAFLRIDYWNDYSFVTMFDVTLFDENGERIELGTTKIGFVGQTTAKSTHDSISPEFTSLTEDFFSLGQDVSYYKKLSDLSETTRGEFLQGIRDVVGNDIIFANASTEEVFGISLLRFVSASSISSQFRRVLFGGAPLTDFDFKFHLTPTENVAGIDLDFKVSASSTPSTNIHAIIGRNGVGKTTLLNEMIKAVINKEGQTGQFIDVGYFSENPISEEYFSSLISVSFSAFDPFSPPPEQSDPGRGTRYTYIGLKDIEDETGVLLKTLVALRDECLTSLTECFSERARRLRWIAAMQTLESDENFARMKLSRLLDFEDKDFKKVAFSLIERMSSGHAIVLLIISKLVAKVEEKTLLIIDEPESHLHPPLLSAFTRALSELLHNRNGVAIVATHSPVVLQEIPRSNSYIISRSRLSMSANRPRIETFGENVGSLTREVFGLEVTQSGFHKVLRKSVLEGHSYDEILDSYNHQLGNEARGILRAMISERDTSAPEL